MVTHGSGPLPGTLGGGGGCRPGDARFERCTFNHCVFQQFDAKEADFVECAFIGTMTSACFYGRSESADGGLRRNTFDGNDLTRAKLRRVEFRGVDLRTSGLPVGPEYLRVDDFLVKAQQARTAMSAWPDAEREKAGWLLRLYEERWNEPLFQWRKRSPTLIRASGRCSSRSNPGSSKAVSVLDQERGSAF